MRLPKPRRQAKEPKRLKRSTKRLRPGRPLWEKRVKVKAAGGIDPDSWQAVVEFYGGLCGWCARAPWTEQDHVKPISRGGLHVLSNLIPSCHACNQRKGTQTWPVPRPHRFMGHLPGCPAYRGATCECGAYDLARREAILRLDE